MRELITALEQIRRRILTVIAALEDGDNVKALAELEEAEKEWKAALQEIGQ